MRYTEHARRERAAFQRTRNRLSRCENNATIRYNMKKTIITILALAGVASAFDDTIWTFEDSLASKEGDGLHTALNVSYGTTKNTTWTTAEAVYAESGLTIGTKVGNYYLDSNLGKAVSLSDGYYIKIGDAYWTDQAGKIGTVSQMVHENNSWKVDTVNTYTNSYTLMAWVKFDTITSAAIFGAGAATDRGVALKIQDGNKIDLCCKGNKDNPSGTLTLLKDTWYNIALTYDSKTDTARYYLNGQQVAVDTTIENFRYAGGTGSAIGSGAADTNNEVMSGDIAEFKILSGALTQAEILKAAHLTTVPEPTTATLSLLALAGLAARRRRK